MKKPVIGLTCIQANVKGKKVNTINDHYFQRVLKAGGVPIILPTVTDKETIREYINMVDGLVFTGGHDVWPPIFGEEPVRQVVEITYERDRFELMLFQEAYSQKIPILGICRGLQVVNIALGGTLYQDLYTQVDNPGGHSGGYDPEEPYHSIEIEDSSIMKEIYRKDKVYVNSEHHQAIKRLGENLRVTSRARDGIIESVESTNDRFVLGVQYHPEAIAPKYSEHQELFNRFMERCRG